MVFAGLLALFLYLAAVNRPSGNLCLIKDYTPWSKATLAVADSLPIQDGGRVKPLATYAGFNMLAIHGSRSMTVSGNDGKPQKLTPTAWLLDALFRPQLAVYHPTFRVDNSAVLEAIGVKPRAKRAHYSYLDIEPGSQKLAELATAYDSIEPNKRNSLQQQILNLAYNLRDYRELLDQLSCVRTGVAISNEPDQQALAISTVLTKAPKIRADVTKAQRDGKPPTGPADYLFRESSQIASSGMHGINILPPAASNDATWLNAGTAIMRVLTGTTTNPVPIINDIKTLETTTSALATGEAEFLKQLTSLHDAITQRAIIRGEGRHLAMEAHYCRADWLLNALMLFFVGTLCATAMWLAGGGRAGRILSHVTLGLTGSALVLCVIAIVERCLIMQRAPIGNLYDTIIFINAACVLLALGIEGFTRRRFALGLAPVLGTVLVLLARRYEIGDPKDHMDPLVAVLASNFWLTVHVITITLGYAAGLLCAFLSTLYILMRGLRLDHGDSELRRILTLVVHAMIGLTLFLSLTGTVLGGIWANESWGRFWGWDPKENGALLLVIWTLVILHASAGGFLKQWGLHFASAFTSCIVVFSWWHVNFLGVGLHNYGFTAGKDVIWAFYLAMVLIISCGGVARIFAPPDQASRGA
jgi:ABC-type transport system involved in cytochrome c biogenesis permease subunit